MTVFRRHAWSTEFAVTGEVAELERMIKSLRARYKQLVADEGADDPFVAATGAALKVLERAWTVRTTWPADRVGQWRRLVDEGLTVPAAADVVDALHTAP